MGKILPLSVFASKLYLLLLFVLASIIFLSFAKGIGAQGGPNPKAQSHIPVCPGPASPGDARCHARVVVDEHGVPQAAVLPAGYGPAQFLGAYNLSGTVSANTTIAIVDAYNHPNILSDLNMYSTTFGIPQMSSCPVAAGTSATPCFQKVDQRGGSAYPKTNAGWALEISLDVQAAHALCQNCNILLVEADSNSYTNLFAAVDRARIMGVKVISNSYGSNEFSGQTTYDSHFTYPGIVFTFSSGDNGYGTNYPASSSFVTAVGGTTLQISGNSYVSEAAWNGAGSGCSAYETKPSFQTDSGCSRRTVADVSADADPNTGAAVYDSVKYYGRSGWFKVGGTSLAAPLIAATYALAGNVSATTQANSLPYSLGNATNLHDVLTGSNGSCGGSYLCTATSGYDGPTGLGSPQGTSGF
jgi:subtilase family serine protease